MFKTVWGDMVLNKSTWTEAIWSEAKILLVWGVAGALVYRDPRTWGIKIGFVILVTAIGLAISLGGAADGWLRSGGAGNWWILLRALAVPLGTAICCINLRWLFPAPPQSESPPPLPKKLE
jgi:hypothetical protein